MGWDEILAGREKAHSSGTECCTSAQPCSTHAMEQDSKTEQTHLQQVPGGAFLPARAHAPISPEHCFFSHQRQLAATDPGAAMKKSQPS